MRIQKTEDYLDLYLKIYAIRASHKASDQDEMSKSEFELFY